jgi:creatinine amidohydrolase/Fe(II)-dependent formamide hydrolase-like protein
MLSPTLTPFLPARINTGPWVVGYSLDQLKARVATDRIVLPICSLGTPPDEIAKLAPLILPPLYHEALDPALKNALVEQIRRCFPFFDGTRAKRNFRGTVEVIELPPRKHPPITPAPAVLTFSVDTAVEQHGPHLPLGTDTIQSYAVLHRLAAETPRLAIGPPFDYGQLTWGLPFGMSIDLTAPLVTRYMCGFVNALLDWLQPASIYVADVHGSLVHRNAIQDGLRRSRCQRWAFRWLYEPLAEWAGERGDPHAGGVETAMVAHINPALVDSQWWPQRIGDLASAQMKAPEAVALSSNLSQFIERVESSQLNGIIGDVHNAASLNAGELMNRMLDLARRDVEALLAR